MLNTVSVQGRLVKPIELKTTASDISVCSFTLANDVGYGDKKKTNFINCVAWRGTADLLSKYVEKGQMIIVSGQLQVRSWDDSEGKKRYATEVIASEVNFCGEKSEKQNNNKEDTNGFAPFEYKDPPF